MGYYDGNTVTAFWNYAQRFAMSDNSYDTNFGPSTDGALNLISGQLNGVSDQVNATGGRGVGRRRRIHPGQRRRPGRGRLLHHHRRAGCDERTKRRRPAQLPPASAGASSKAALT